MDDTREPIEVALDLASQAADDPEMCEQGKQLGQKILAGLEKDRQRFVAGVVILGLYLAMISMTESLMRRALRRKQH